MTIRSQDSFPPPSGTIYFAGVGLVALGGMLIGAGLARGSDRRT